MIPTYGHKKLNFFLTSLVVAHLRPDTLPGLGGISPGSGAMRSSCESVAAVTPVLQSFAKCFELMCLAIFENTNPILSRVIPEVELSHCFESLGRNFPEVCDDGSSWFSQSIVSSESTCIILDSVKILMAGE